MDKNCKECSEIIAFEQALDVRASALVSRVKEFCRPVREHNNQRWERFARWCRLPIVGSWILNHFKKPSRLEPKPEYYNETWYRGEGDLIEIEAEKLEQMKVNHMEHWGDEAVSPADSSDPAGYYTPLYASRRECYARNLSPFVPNKYDFHSLAGVPKCETDDLVICPETKQLVPPWKEPSHPPELTPSMLSQPGFNEWRGADHYANCGHHPERL